MMGISPTRSIFASTMSLAAQPDMILLDIEFPGTSKCRHCCPAMGSDRPW